MISFVSANQKSVSGMSFALGSVTLDTPTGAAAGDVLVAVGQIPQAEFEASGGSGRFYQLTAADWQVLEVLEYRSGDSKRYVVVCYRVLDAVPTSLTFNVSREIINVPDPGDALTIDVSVACYRGVETSNPIQAHDTSTNEDDSIQLVVTRAPAVLVHTTVGTGVSDGLTLRSSVGDVRLAETTENLQGRTLDYSVTSTGDDVGRVLLALLPFVAAPDTDPPPTIGTGVGRLVTGIRSPLHVTAQRVQSGALVGTVAPKLLAADMAFDALGCCVGGMVTFAQNPFWEPYTRLIKISYTTKTPAPALYFAGVATTTTETDELFDVELLPLSDLWLDDAVGADDYPQHITITEHLNLNSGLVVDRLAGTVDAWQTWRTFLKRRFEGIGEATFGVGADGRYIQGRPQDAVTLTIDAGNYQRESHGMSLTPYISAWYGEPADFADPVVETETRADLPALAPRRVANADEDSGGFVAPIEYGLPFYEPSSYTLSIPDAIVIPPIKVVNLPNGQTQYASGCRIKVEVDSGGGASLVSTLRTRTIPHPTDRRRDRLGRFV
jgi:hypothetical protein